MLKTFSEADIKNRLNIVHRLISALYKAGYEKITIYYESFEELQMTQKTINLSFSDRKGDVLENMVFFFPEINFKRFV